MEETLSDTWAIGILLLYLVIGVGVFYWKSRKWTTDWNLLALYCVNRIYSPLMFHWRSNRPCPWSENESAIILANHRSPVDPMLLWMNDQRWNRGPAVRPVRFLMAKEYYQIPGVHWIGKTMQSIPVDRSVHDAKPVMKALRILKENNLVGVFPEGGINKENGIKEANPGIAFLALRAKVPVYPVFVKNSPQAKSMVGCFCKPERVEIIYGDPIDLSAYEGKRKNQELLREACDYMMTQLADLGGVEYHGNQSKPQDEKPIIPMNDSVG